MNEKTARLIKRYANHVDEKEKQAKRRWNSLPQNRRHEERKRMQAKLGE